MALDSILSTAIIPSPPKSTGPNSMGPAPADRSVTGTNGTGDTTDSSNATGTADGTPVASRSAATGERGANGSAAQNTSAHSASRSSGRSGTQFSDSRPARSSGSSGASSSSNTRTQAQAGAKAHGGASTRSNSNIAQSARQAQGTKGNAGATAASGSQQPQSGAPTFLQALAQSQADAEAAANVDTTGVAASDESTAKSGKSKVSQDTSGGSASLAFLPQSLAAAMAGVQSGAQPGAQFVAQAPSSQSSEDAAGDGDSTEAISTNGGSAARAIIASLEKSAEDLKATPDSTDHLKGDSQATPGPATNAVTPDGTNAAAVAFQAHMAIGSHSQQPSAIVNGNKVEAPVGTTAFNDELGGKITWLANQGVQSASVQLSPEHLGPVNVHISIQDGSARVSFNAAHADTRAALEQALPRLREMFSTQGLTLTDASVSHQSPRGQPQKQAISSIGAIGGVSEDANVTSITSAASSRLGLVDTYA